MPFSVYIIINDIPSVQDTGYKTNIPDISLNNGNINCIQTIRNKHIDVKRTSIGGIGFPTPLIVPAKPYIMLS